MTFYTSAIFFTHKFYLSSSQFFIHFAIPKIIAIGIPTVVDALTLARDIIPDFVFENDIKSEIYPKGQMMVVTPREIDLLIERGAQLISLAVNSALHQNFNLADLISLIG